MSGARVPLLVTDESGQGGQAPKLFILQRWLPLCVNLRQQGGGKSRGEWQGRRKGARMGEATQMKGAGTHAVYTTALVSALCDFEASR